jgi:hypothetical protein
VLRMTCALLSVFLATALAKGPDKPDKIDKPDKADKADKADRADKADKGDRGGSKGERISEKELKDRHTERPRSGREIDVRRVGEGNQSTRDKAAPSPAPKR